MARRASSRKKTPITRPRQNAPPTTKHPRKATKAPRKKVEKPMFEGFGSPAGTLHGLICRTNRLVIPILVDHETTNVGETGASIVDHYIKRLKHVIGMEFENEHIAYELYNTYAGNVGFSVRKF
ncbi:hypothetical protein ACQ4PT_009350 [Festuca glaucescens]